MDNILSPQDAPKRLKMSFVLTVDLQLDSFIILNSERESNAFWFSHRTWRLYQSNLYHVFFPQNLKIDLIIALEVRYNLFVEGVNLYDILINDLQ